MRVRTIMAVSATAGAAAAASAQPPGIATYSLQFGNGENTIVLGPGQSTTVTVFVSFEPGIGAQVGSALPLQGEVLGLNNGGFSITGTPRGGNATGNFSLLPGMLSLIPPYNFPKPSLGTSAGNSHNGVLWGHGFIFTPVHPLPENPGKIWTGLFTMGAWATSGQINFAFTGLTGTGIDVSSGPISQGAIPWVADFTSSPGVGGTIFVPAPAGLTLLGLGGLVALGRRRSRPGSCFP
jgi:MYXO-CTERM domain-containing protein